MKALLTNIAKVLLRAALDETVRRGLPEIYRRLDAEVPLLLTNSAPPNKIKGVIASTISDVGGKRTNNAQLEAVIGLYDPIKAALRNLP